MDDVYLYKVTEPHWYKLHSYYYSLKIKLDVFWIFVIYLANYQLPAVMDWVLRAGQEDETTSQFSSPGSQRLFRPMKSQE